MLTVPRAAGCVQSHLQADLAPCRSIGRRRGQLSLILVGGGGGEEEAATTATVYLLSTADPN